MCVLCCKGRKRYFDNNNFILLFLNKFNNTEAREGGKRENGGGRIYEDSGFVTVVTNLIIQENKCLILFPKNFKLLLLY